MALTEDRPAIASEAPSPAGDPQGFRPASRRRARLAGGAALAAVAIGGNVLVYSSLDDTTEVLQVVTDIRAGDQIEAGDLRTVSVDVDDNVPAVPADQIGLVVGQYARTYIASGSLVVGVVLQTTPLVTAGASVVAIETRPTAVPSGLRERSQVLLVLDNGDLVPPKVVRGRVVARPGEVTNSSGRVAISLEVASVDAPAVVTAEEVGVILVDPGADPATETVVQPPATVPAEAVGDDVVTSEPAAPADPAVATTTPVDDAEGGG